MSQAGTPSFGRHLWLLWRFRLSIALNRGRGGRVLSALAFAASCAPAVGLFIAFDRLLGWGPVASSAVWPPFLVNLTCFVTTCVWCAWPMLSAGVDDHSELSRYLAFPITGFRLMLSSTLASLFEPRALVFYAPVAGAAMGYSRLHPPVSMGLAVALFAAFVAFNAALGRVGLHLVLGVLRRPRNARLIGGFMVALILACSFIPPIDVSWLFSLGAGASVLSERVIEDAARALSRVPPGWFGAGLAQLSLGSISGALEELLSLCILTVLSLSVAQGLLLDFHRQLGRGGSFMPLSRRTNPFAKTPGVASTLLARELVELWHNPRARLLACVPFLLAIVLRLLSGRELFVFLAGATADAWVLGALCLYGTVVIASTFSQNTFAYDGHGLAFLLAAPVDLAKVLKAKNLAHALSATALSVVVSGFYLVYFRKGGLWDWACAMAAVACILPVLLSAGNLLSVFFPVRFHADLRRRDKLPFVASLLGVAAAAVGSAPFAYALRLEAKAGVSASTVGRLLSFAVAAWIFYGLLLGPSISLLRRRREQVLAAVTRD